MRRTPRLAALVFCTAAAALIITSCGSGTPAESVLSTTAATTAPSTAADPSTTTDPPATVEPAAVETMPETTLAEPSAPTSAACRRLTDFDGGEGWVVVNDGVMGGRSNGAIGFADSVMQFTGDVVTAGGGFTIFLILPGLIKEVVIK